MVKNKNKELYQNIALGIIVIIIASMIFFNPFKETAFDTGFIKNIELSFTKDIPIYENGENIQVKNLISGINPRGRNSGGYAQLGLIFYYVDEVYIGGQVLGLSVGNDRTVESSLISPEFFLKGLDNGDHTLTAKYFIALGGNTCSSGSSASCGQRLPELSNCITGDRFYSIERFSDSVWNFMQKIPCEYIEGKSATGVLFPEGYDWSSKVDMDYKFTLSKKFAIQNVIVKVCDEGQESCNGQEYSVCENNEYINKGLVDGKCGYTATVPYNPDTEPVVPDNEDEDIIINDTKQQECDSDITACEPPTTMTNYTKIMVGIGIGLVLLIIVGIVRAKSKGKRRR